MKIKLSRPFSGSNQVDEFDVKQVKKALNRVGFYVPYEKTGITGIPDAAVFTALKEFQKTHGLRATGAAKPEDETIRALNREAAKTPEGSYIWHTVGDDHVRPSHAELNGTVREWADSPDPGEEFNCRCWAEAVSCNNEFIKQNIISQVKDDPDQWTWLNYLAYYYYGGGQSISLPEIGWLDPVIKESKNQIFPNVEEQVAELARKIEQGDLHYTTINTYDFGGVSYPIGEATVSSETIGKVSINGKCLIIIAEVTYTFFDDFTDILSIRELNEKFQAEGYPYLSKKFPLAVPKDIPESIRFHFEKGDWTELKGTPYFINGTWKTKLSAIIKRDRQ